MSNDFYVYVLLDPRKCCTPFYVGKGRGDRMFTSLRERGNPLKSRVIRRIREKGLEPIPMIWKNEISEDDAFLLEKELIQRWGRRDKKTGILTNLTDGGEGVRGLVWTPEMRASAADRMRGAKSPTFGGHTEEAKKKMSESQKRIRAEGYVKYHSEEHKARLRVDNPGGRATAKPIYQIDDDGSIVNQWPSANIAAKSIGANKTNICNNAKSGSTRKAYGFWWRYVDAEDISSGRLDVVSLLAERKNKNGNLKRIVQIDGNVEIKTWGSVREASDALRLNYATLWKAAKEKKLCGGFCWKFANQ